MNDYHIEKELKNELNRIDKKLRRTEALHSAARIGSGLGVGLILSTMTSQVPLLVGMAASGVLLNIAARRIIR